MTTRAPLSIAYDEQQDRIVQLVSPTADAPYNQIRYITIADLHCEEPEQWESTRRQLEHVVSLCHRTPIDFVFVAGDLICGRNPYPDIGSKQNNTDYIRRMMQLLKAAGVPVLCAFGNHDDNSHHWEDDNDKSGTCPIGDIITKDEFYSLCIAPFAPVCHDSQNPKSCYYYLDIEAKKTRVIVMDTTDYPLTNAHDARYADYTGRTQSRLSARQIRWLCEEALTKSEEGWQYIVLSHVSLSDTFMGTTRWVAAYGTWAWEALRALNARGTFSRKDTPITCGDGKEYLTTHADFSDFRSRVILHHFGHIHGDACATVDGILTCTTAHSWMDTKEPIPSFPDSPAAWTFYPERSLDDISEALFDVAVCTPGESYHRFRFGLGADTHVSLEN